MCPYVCVCVCAGGLLVVVVASVANIITPSSQKLTPSAGYGNREELTSFPSKSPLVLGRAGNEAKGAGVRKTNERTTTTTNKNNVCLERIFHSLQIQSTIAELPSGFVFRETPRARERDRKREGVCPFTSVLSFLRTHHESSCRCVCFGVVVVVAAQGGL